VRIRLNEKPLLFITRITGSLPRRLYGDEARIRQVLLNLLSNAIKYTREGHIALSIYGKPLPDAGPREGEAGGPRFTLCFEVADTGIGIKSEDMGRLFGNFEQFDVQYNRGIEGTGLGLAISRSLCRLMGGDIGVQSVYGQGSTFTIHLPQGILDGEPFAQVEKSESLAVLVYEKRPLYAESLVYTLENLGVPCSPVQSGPELRGCLQNRSYSFVFTSSALYPESREILEEQGSGAVLVLLTIYGEEYRPDIPALAMPVHPLAVANILSGTAPDAPYPETKDKAARFIAPSVRVLLVDDISINLDVAEGLLSVYGVRTDLSLSGREAVELVKKNSYDLVFMDHMMPGMDGIEAAGAIRAWEEAQGKKKVPIIALTANAIVGMKEMFLEKGFDDYISKPIELSKLDEIMSRWIPGEKRIKAGGLKGETPGDAGLAIPGVDVKWGVSMTGGTEEGYRKALAWFCEDAAGRLPLFAAGLAAGDLPLVNSQARTIKGAAANIGAAGISAEAAALETAGKAGNLGAVREGLSFFQKHLALLIEDIKQALETGENPELTGPPGHEGN
ncbi:MAG: response regulator, partial [Treponema sp.]|nr:response regulator [Treponema sp.]